MALIRHNVLSYRSTRHDAFYLATNEELYRLLNNRFLETEKEQDVKKKKEKKKPETFVRNEDKREDG